MECSMQKEKYEGGLKNSRSNNEKPPEGVPTLA
jgi:hypothetical protein